MRGYLLEIKHGLNRMVNIVKSLLACSRNTTPSLEKIDPNSVIEQSLAAIQSEAFHKNIIVEKKLETDLPCIIDFGLERAITNLLRNAVDAVDRGGKIKVITTIQDGHIVIEVKDNGCGISKEAINKIFDPFYTTKDMDKGCGLGLTIVSEIIKSYDGEIKLQSVLQKGTTFTVLIPIK